jgi:hypothetical protein
MRVITFSRTFPAYHPKAGQQTHFVEKIWNSITELGLPHFKNKDFSDDFMWSILPLSNYRCKYHTIRAGNRWKVGDKFSPRVWSGKPYNSKQIIIAPDIEIKKVWDFEIKDHRFIVDGMVKGIDEAILTIAENDGLTIFGFMDWFKFPKEFKGQIICWNENINY